MLVDGDESCGNNDSVTSDQVLSLESYGSFDSVTNKPVISLKA